MFMATKTITITEDAYDLLAKLKRENESFSEVIKRTIKKGSILEFAGAWNMNKKEAEELKERIKKMRDFSDTDFEKRVKERMK